MTAPILVVFERNGPSVPGKATNRAQCPDQEGRRDHGLPAEFELHDQVAQEVSQADLRQHVDHLEMQLAGRDRHAESGSSGSGGNCARRYGGSSSPSPAPWARRIAMANGIATPTMNMNAGWIRSQKAIHSQGLCSN